MNKELEKIREELLGLIDEYFPKIKPMGVNKGRGEAAVIVGTALARFESVLVKQRKEIIKKAKRCKALKNR